ncbi:MAG: DUF6798 domain-containing protein [Isosphaeraceae bacterium]
MPNAEHGPRDDVSGQRPPASASEPARWLGYCLILGLYFTLRGYHSLDGDQAYRLPLLLHRLNPAIYAADPFVRAFDTFNPHRGSLMVLGWVTGFLGLAAGLLGVFIVLFLATCQGIDRLARQNWTGSGTAAQVGWVAITLVLMARAGNIGTNHLFEAMVLDRLMALALGWLALAAVVSQPELGWWRAAIVLALAAVVHPSLGLQLALIVMGSWTAWALLGDRASVRWTLALRGVIAAGLSVLPGLAQNLAPGGSLLQGLPPGDFWTLAVELQSPQHMLPHLWRMPQWLAWGAYLVLAALALRRWTPARVRLVAMLTVTLVGLGAAWVAIEWLHQPRITVFQPFRMATVARGLALVLVAGRLVELWHRGEWLARVRPVLIAVALAGDWMLVIVTIVETATTLAESLGVSRRGSHLIFAGLIVWGLCFLARHDTESGHWPILVVLIGGLTVPVCRQVVYPRFRDQATLRWATVLAWVVPTLALCAGLIPADHPVARSSLVRGLIARCRFAAAPIDDIERLAAWCREHTPDSARFIGPPGPKTFRLWSRRSLAFNRAGSPYHAAGLADWFARFQDHVDVHDSPEVFVQKYLSGRHELEARYDELSDEKRAELAVRQGADHVIALAPGAPGSRQDSTSDRDSPLWLLHREGRFAVYRIRPEMLSQLQRQGQDQRQR